MTDLVASLWYSSGTSLLFSPESYIKHIKHKGLSPLELCLLYVSASLSDIFSGGIQFLKLLNTRSRPKAAVALLKLFS